jgi:hypothetical protein
MQTNPDILVLTETWISGDILDLDINIEGYRVEGRGGGMAISIKKIISLSLY